MNRIVLTIVLISIYCCPLLANICNNDNDPVVVIVKDEQTTGKPRQIVPLQGFRLNAIITLLPTILNCRSCQISERWMLCLRIRPQEGFRTMSETVLQAGL